MATVSSTSVVNANLPGELLDRVPLQTLGQKEFLQLLTTQLTNQDPLEPVKDTEFIAQMAQFTSLEQVKATYHFMQANAMVGQEVTIRVLSPQGDPTEITGKVTGLNLEQGTPKIIVNNEAYTIDKVVRFGPATPSQDTN